MPLCHWPTGSPLQVIGHNGHLSNLRSPLTRILKLRGGMLKSCILLPAFLRSKVHKFKSLAPAIAATGVDPDHGAALVPERQ